MVTNKLPIVSIIVPCYNYSTFLSSTLKSVLNQTFFDWECIIVDDGSTDNTAEVANNFVNEDSRFIYIYQVNNGLSAARNKGIRIAKGRYIQFLDADDLLEKKKLQIQTDILDSSNNIDIIYSNVRYFVDGSPGITSSSYDMMNVDWMPKISGKGRVILNKLIFRNIMVVNAPLIRSSVVQEVGYFDEELKAFEDWFYWLKCGIANKMFHYNCDEDTYAIVRLHSHSMTTSQERLFKAELLMRQKLHKLLADFYADDTLIGYQKVNMTYYYTRIGQPTFKEIYEGKILIGLYGIFGLIQKTNQTLFYLKNAIYWLKERLLK